MKRHPCTGTHHTTQAGGCAGMGEYSVNLSLNRRPSILFNSYNKLTTGILKL